MVAINKALLALAKDQSMTDPTPSVPVLCHRLHTGGGKWCWVDGAPNAQCLEDANTFGWQLELAVDRAHIADLQRELADAREWSAELSALLDAAKFERDQAESALAADPCVRHACKRVRMEMQAEIDAARRDAERWAKLKPLMVAANFYPEDPKGLDLGPDAAGSVALIFLLPKGSRVSACADLTIDNIAAMGATHG